MSTALETYLAYVAPLLMLGAGVSLYAVSTWLTRRGTGTR